MGAKTVYHDYLCKRFYQNNHTPINVLYNYSMLIWKYLM